MNFLRAIAVVLGSVGFAHLGLASEEDCGDWLVRLSSTHPKVAHAVQSVLSLRPDVVGLRELPTWHQFEMVVEARDQVVEAKQAHPDIETVLQPYLSDIQAAGQKFELRHRPRSDAMHLRKEILTWLCAIVYRDLNQELPSGFRIPLSPLPRDYAKEKSMRDARKLVASQSEQLDKLISTTGFESMEDFHKALAEGTEHQKQALQILQEQQLEVVMRRPESARWWLPKVGFHNQFVTRSSNGLMDWHSRNLAERNYVGVPAEEYDGASAYLKPKYVTFRLPDSMQAGESSSGQYGNDLFILKIDAIEDRLTWTVGIP